ARPRRRPLSGPVRKRPGPVGRPGALDARSVPAALGGLLGGALPVLGGGLAAGGAGLLGLLQALGDLLARRLAQPAGGEQAAGVDLVLLRLLAGLQRVVGAARDAHAAAGLQHLG